MSVVNEIDVKALRETIDAVRATPKLGQVTFAVDGTWQGGFRIKAQTGALTQGGERDEQRVAKHTMTSDEPTALLGTDTAVSPAEYVLQALAGCYTVTLTANAASRGIELKSFRLELEGDIDLRGFLGLDASVKAGYDGLEYTVFLKARATPSQLERVHDFVCRTSPNRFNLSQPIRLETRLVVA